MKKSILLSYALSVGPIVTLVFHGAFGVLLDIASFSPAQRTDIAILRERLKHDLRENFMRDEVYLAKWLVVNDFNVEATIDHLKEHLKWRDQHKISTISEENWEEMKVLFPYSRDTTDKTGRPILYFDLEEWDIAKFEVERNSLAELGRYFVKMIEESNAHVRDLRRQGSNITQFNLVVNLDGYKADKHGCWQCLYFYRDTGKLLAAHFPRSTEKIIFVNVPLAFEVVYSFLGEETQRSFKMLGQDRTLWEPILLEYISKDQFPESLLSITDRYTIQAEAAPTNTSIKL